MCSGSEAGSYLRLIDSCINQRKAQGPSRTSNKSKEEEEVFHSVKAVEGKEARVHVPTLKHAPCSTHARRDIQTASGLASYRRATHTPPSQDRDKATSIARQVYTTVKCRRQWYSTSSRSATQQRGSQEPGEGNGLAARLQNMTPPPPPWQTYPVRCRVPGYYEPCSERVRVH